MPRRNREMSDGPGGGLHGGWLLPMAAVALLAAVVAARTLPLVGTVTGAGAWLLVLAAGRARHMDLATLSSVSAQLVCAVVVALLGMALVVLARRSGWSRALPAE